jgi:hypothetical protein
MRKKDYETRRKDISFFQQKGITKRAAALMLVCTLILTMTPVLADGDDTQEVANGSVIMSETDSEIESEETTESNSEIESEETTEPNSEIESDAITEQLTSTEPNSENADAEISGGGTRLRVSVPR